MTDALPKVWGVRSVLSTSKLNDHGASFYRFLYRTLDIDEDYLSTRNPLNTEFTPMVGEDVQLEPHHIVALSTDVPLPSPAEGQRADVW